MEETSVNLSGGSPYFAEWKQDFITNLEVKFPGKVAEQKDEVQVSDGEHTSKIKLSQDESDIKLRIQSDDRGSGGGRSFGSIFILIILMMLFFGGWRFAIMPFFFVSPVWIILFFVICAIPGHRYSRNSLMIPISRLARESWARIIIQHQKAKAESTEDNDTFEDLKPEVEPWKSPNAPINDGRPPDEEYLLSPDAAEAARTPALVRRVDRGLKEKDKLATYCPYCGSQHEPDAKFCWNCGSNLQI